MAEEGKLHIVMFLWLAFGHIIPNLELAKHITQKGHLVSFVSTPRNTNRLPKLPPSLVSSIKFVKLDLPKEEKLPENTEATSDVPFDTMQYLKNAYNSLQQPLTQFLQSSYADWLIYDLAPYWAGTIASMLGIKSAFYSIFPALALGFFGPAQILKDNVSYWPKPEDFTVSPPWVPFPSTVAWKLFEIKRIMESRDGNVSGVSDSYLFGSSIQNCDSVAVRSCYEFEPKWLQLRENIYQKPVFPVGELPRTKYDDEAENNDTWRWVRDWLDKHGKGSVVYVAFGSEAKPSQEEVNQIALGLEKTRMPFFWALRVRRGPSDPEVLVLPEGFEERTRERGVVWTSWVPQLKILGHDLVGRFLTHTGWRSVVEGIQNEKPLVVLTFLAKRDLMPNICKR